MNVLVAGGAGYVGSHAVRALLDAGHVPIVLDTLEKGHREAVGEAELICGNVLNHELVSRVCRQFEIEAVMNFAAYIEVGESMADPMKYYANNAMAVLSLLKTILDHGIRLFVFSSTAAVYGQPETVPISEDCPPRPVNVYGHSKAMVEETCAWLARLGRLSYASLRYFNAGGAHVSGTVGEDHLPETHLIPILLEVASGKRGEVLVFGDDYDTDDGTCVRDYVHVSDIADAHVAALDYLEAGGEPGAFNLGTGTGHSVRQVIDEVRRVTGHALPFRVAPRRPGDPAILVADPSKAAARLRWRPRYSDLGQIVGSAWKWHSTHPEGYRSGERQYP